jgi:hypothetical protein
MNLIIENYALPHLRRSRLKCSLLELRIHEPETVINLSNLNFVNLPASF